MRRIFLWTATALLLFVLSYGILYGIIRVASSTDLTRAEVNSQCKSKFPNAPPTEEQLAFIVRQHSQWEKSGRSNGERANLCEANLYGVRLRVEMRGADWSGIKLVDADLSGSDLFGADLRAAEMIRTNLNCVHLNHADLTGAEILKADLSEAVLFGANMRSVMFQPEPDKLPIVGAVAYARNLSEMYFGDEPEALVRLRDAFKAGGYRQQEREITYAINHTRVKHQLDSILNLRRINVGSLLAGTFNYILFDFTTRWGMVPGRALAILVIMIPIFAIPYAIALCRSADDGIWKKWADDRVRANLGTKEPERLQVNWRQSISLALQFSLISAFSIGWKELNVGNWIQRLQPKDYTLRASGWVRAVSGAQSLLGGFLLAIWALTAFGRPFE